MGASCTTAKKGTPKRKPTPAPQEPNKTNDTLNANKVSNHTETNEEIIHSDFCHKGTNIVVPSMRLLNNPEQVDDNGEDFGDQDGQTPILWQGANSNLPTSKKHTDQVTISQLKPWMRVTIPVKVVSLGVPSKVSSHHYGDAQSQPRQTSKGRGQKLNPKQQQQAVKTHEVEAIAVIGDSSGCINMLVVDQQIPLFQSQKSGKDSGEDTCLYLVNVHCRQLRSKHLRLEADQWSQIKPIDMATLIASSAQVDHVQANEAQSKLNNLISVDIKNDMSQSIVLNQQRQQYSPATAQDHSSPDRPQNQPPQQQNNVNNRHRNRSRSNNARKNSQQNIRKSMEPATVQNVVVASTSIPRPPQPNANPNSAQQANQRSQSKRRRNNRNRRSRSNHHQNQTAVNGVPQPPNGGQIIAAGNQINLTNQKAQNQKKLTTIGAFNGPPLMILDVQNIAMRYGHSQKFACLGIKIAIDFWVSRGHRVIGFLPDYLLWREKIMEKWDILARAQQDPQSVDPAILASTLTKLHQMPDDVDYLISLQQSGILIGTPSQDYDDSYCLSYTRQQCQKGQEAFIISNDLFRDYIASFFKRKNQSIADKGQVNDLMDQEKRWLREHVVSYTFILDEFQPNPDSVLFELLQTNAFGNTTSVIAQQPETTVEAYQIQEGKQAHGLTQNQQHEYYDEEVDGGEDDFSYDGQQDQTDKSASPFTDQSPPFLPQQMMPPSQVVPPQDQAIDNQGYSEQQYYGDEVDQGSDEHQAPQVAFCSEFAPLGNYNASPQVLELRQEDIDRGLPEGHVSTGNLPYGYYRQQAKKNGVANINM